MKKRSFLEKPTKYGTLCDARFLSLLLSFFVPAAVLLLFYALHGCAPFGKNSLCTMDGFSQYYPMLENMTDAIRGDGLFYSFSGGLGYNLWTQSAYYTNSPLWLLLYILPKSTHIAVIDLLVMLRFALSGLFFSYFLDSRKQADHSRLLPYVALSTAYALSGWAAAFANQFMWMDCMMLLPLVVVGIDRLFAEKSPVLYTVSLFLCIWSCFYIAFMVCIFAVLWMLKLLFEKQLPFSLMVKKTARFAAFSVLAAGMSAVSLLPLLKTISLTAASDMGLEGARTYGTVIGFIANTLIFSKHSLEYGAPNVYCGMISVGMAVFMLFCKRIPRRKRLVHAGIAAFMLLSFFVQPLYYLWHGFHFPNQLPGRFSFVYIFFVLFCASSYIEYGLFEKNGRKRFMTKVLFAALLVGVCTNFHMRITSNPDSLFKFSDIGSSFSELSENGKEFSRQEISNLKSNNQGLQYNYHGIGWYSSTMSAAQYDFFQRLGLPRYAKNVSTYYENNEITDALFGIKYLADGETGAVTQQKNALPLAFLADSAVKQYNIRSYDEPEKARQELWNAVCGEECDVASGVKKLRRCAMTEDSFRSSHITGHIDCDKNGVLFTTIPDDGGWTVYIDGKKVNSFRSAELLLACEITSGSHSVEMKYTPPLFYAGLLLSVCSTAALAAAVLYFKKREKTQAKA